jgi:chromatin assembly factor 1 subunit A
MEHIDSSPLMPASPRPVKREAPDDEATETKPLNLKGNQFMMPTPPDTEGSSNASPTANEQQRAGSPALSISTLSTVDLSSTKGAPGASAVQPTPSSSTQPPAKRRKLTPSETLEKAREKEAKEKEKAEKKAQKDEEKRVKDEEKRKKAEEKEAKKREKELEEQRKEEAKLKKERSQMRLGAFFGAKPATPAKPSAPSTAVDCTPTLVSTARRKSLSLEPYDAVADQIRRSASPVHGTPPQPAEAPKHSDTPAKPAISDYRKYFLPFQLPSHSSLAPTFKIPNPDDLAYWQGAFDDELHDPSFQEKVDLGLIEPTAVVDHMFRSETQGRRGLPVPNLRRLVDHIQGTSTQPIDLTQDAQSPAPVHALQAIPRRHIQFEEDVRPAYFGTYTKVTSPRTMRKAMLNPYSKPRKDTDYDYDSEAEWDEPEEGEDILGDEDDEAESLGDADEMDGFLDDEDDALKNKRKMITGDLQPSCTGLCWENKENVIVQSIEGDDVSGTPQGMRGMRMGFLIPGFTGQTIDPFSAVYWSNDMAPPAVPITDAPRSTAGRPPLQERNSNGPLIQSVVGAAAGEKGPITAVTTTTSTQGAKRGPKPQPKVLTTEDLEEFKEAVIGSNLKKADLLKALKSR